jgi:hypothetical protein
MTVAVQMAICRHVLPVMLEDAGDETGASWFFPCIDIQAGENERHGQICSRARCGMASSLFGIVILPER